MLKDGVNVEELAGANPSSVAKYTSLRRKLKNTHQRLRSPRVAARRPSNDATSSPHKKQAYKDLPVQLPPPGSLQLENQISWGECDSDDPETKLQFYQVAAFLRKMEGRPQSFRQVDDAVNVNLFEDTELRSLLSRHPKVDFNILSLTMAYNDKKKTV